MSKYQVNQDGVAKARQMIESHHYDLDTPWSDGAPSAEGANEFIERHGYDGYGEWHLAIDTEASQETKDRYGFPFGDFRRVSRAALIHAKQRAAQNGHDAVADAAGQLLERLDRAHAA
ncbi:MAG: hypothetical protein M0004_02480 [Actinomycetota bacterium]|nr:hypothetical protein [Actinomycetota bacterium]